MSKKRKIEIDGLSVKIDNADFVSLTDIAKNAEKPAHVIRRWLRLQKTIVFLKKWEEYFNPNVKVDKFDHLYLLLADESISLSPSNYVEHTEAIGIKTVNGRGGGTYAHPDIALHFCSWYKPEFHVYFIAEFRRLKEEEAKRIKNNRTWHISKITDYVDNARILLDNIPGQLPENVRVREEE